MVGRITPKISNRINNPANTCLRISQNQGWVQKSGSPRLASDLPIKGELITFTLSPRAALKPTASRTSTSSRCRSLSLQGVYTDLQRDRKSTRLNSSHVKISYAV